MVRCYFLRAFGSKVTLFFIAFQLYHSSGSSCNQQKQQYCSGDKYNTASTSREGSCQWRTVCCFCSAQVKPICTLQLLEVIFALWYEQKPPEKSCNRIFSRLETRIRCSRYLVTAYQAIFLAAGAKLDYVF